MDRITDGRELLKFVTFAAPEDIDARQAWEIEAWLDALCYQWTDEYWQIPENVIRKQGKKEVSDGKTTPFIVSPGFEEAKSFEEIIADDEFDSTMFHLNEKLSEGEFNEALNYIFNINEAVMSLGRDSTKKTVICLLTSSVKLIKSRIDSLQNEFNPADDNASLAETALLKQF